MMDYKPKMKIVRVPISDSMGEERREIFRGDSIALGDIARRLGIDTKGNYFYVITEAKLSDASQVQVSIGVYGNNDFLRGCKVKENAAKIYFEKLVTFPVGNVDNLDGFLNTDLEN